MKAVLCLAFVVLVALSFTTACTTVRGISNEEMVAKREEDAVKTLGGRSAIFWASMRAKAAGSATMATKDLNIKCEDGFEGAARCMKLAAQVIAEPNLREAFETAKTLGVAVVASTSFAYGDGWVKINIDSPTEKILDYLLLDKDDSK